MDLFTDTGPLRAHLSAVRARHAVALVPTMGALHDGHRACIDVARAVRGAYVVATIFVNPTQFGAGEDLSRYPRDLDGDLEKCRSWGCDAVFAPGEGVMYPTGQRVWVDVAGLTDPLCGRSRPGHFRGVATVVAKLFHIVQPDVAVFGQKDAQQALVIREMVRQLDMPVDIRLARTVREPDGLALSSRNAYLSRVERECALGIHRALVAAGQSMASGERDPQAVIGFAVEGLRQSDEVELEYAELRSARDLSTLARIEGRVILAIAARVGRTRLIDNMVFDVSGDDVRADVALFGRDDTA